jgi:hemoglobin
MTEIPPFTAITEASIVHLVDAFYAKVRRDPVLAPIFAAAIDENAWPAHLRRMHEFWSSVMLTTGRYKGNPVEVHQRVTGLEPSLFVNWLDLFEATAAELFIPAMAGEFSGKARRIAESLRLALFFRPTEPWPTDLRQHPSVAAH